MKKIQLSDGMPSDLNRKDVTEKTEELLDLIETMCYESELSYVEINKALYLADKELYMEKISS